MRKRVLILEPRGVEGNVFDRFTHLPLLGPLLLGTILKRDGFDVRVLNENLLGRELSLSEMDADFLLLSCLTPTVERGYEIAARFKRLNPGARVIMGGIHATFLPEEALAFSDHVVTCEGEGVIADLLRYGSNEKLIKGTPVTDLDSLPPVDFSILSGGERLNISPVMTSRGCPHACNFCTVTEMFGRGFRAQSVGRVLEELERIPLEEVFFYDDNFTALRRRSHELMDALIRRRGELGIRKWSAQVRTDVARDEELVEKMSEAGCSRVYVGIESISQEALNSMKKRQTIEDIRYSLEIFHRHGIRVHGMFIFGNDEDDPGILRETSRFVRINHIDSVQFMILTPFPGTELFERLEGEGRMMHRMWRYFDGMHVVFRPRNFSPLELQEMTISAFEDFYSILGAANEGLNLLYEEGQRLFHSLSVKAVPATASMTNILVKAGGRFIVEKWKRLNREYIHYLKDLDRRLLKPAGERT